MSEELRLSSGLISVLSVLIRMHRLSSRLRTENKHPVQSVDSRVETEIPNQGPPLIPSVYLGIKIRCLG